MDDLMKDQFDVQSALQQQQTNAQQGMNAAGIVGQQQQVQAALVEQTNPDHILESVRLKLEGYRQKWDGSLIKVSDPLMNKRGISMMLFNLSTIVNQNTILSHLEEREISKMIIRVSDDIVDDLTLHWNEYGIEEEIMRDHILNATLIPSFMALKRAWKQNEKNWLNRAVVESISSSPQPTQNTQGGFFSRFKL